ncbi:MAG: hypothetical protein DRJ55_05935 [Thermoprotei archaeon]|nr:MAG: hypothetical protein DRJ55_05935 [Thermoprotei archaeon]
MLSPEEAVKFHGHAGPFLAWGYRAGRLATEKLKPNGIKEMSCVAKLPLEIPYTCIVDGVQAGSCCTLGKQNLKVEPGDEVELTFKCNGRILKVAPALDLKRFLLRHGKREAYKLVMKMSENMLFRMVEENGR